MARNYQNWQRKIWSHDKAHGEDKSITSTGKYGRGQIQ